jgi:acetoin utilization deacetylase AcuC-like enzyme
MLLVASDPVFAAHDTGRGHPERAARLDAVMTGVSRAGLDDALRPLAVRPATTEELERVHPPEHLEHIRELSERGGGAVDADTVLSSGSWTAAVHAAGAGLAAAEALERGDGDAAFLALRPPGHHATPRRAMGFCLFNNVAVTAAALIDRGQRVAIVDYDAHHGNGTQETFYRDPRVLYVSLHQWPLYPGTGKLDEVGRDAGAGTTCNLPLPPGATGDVYLAAIDDVIVPLVERFDPQWLLLSAGFDGHRADPLTGLALAADDFGLITARLSALVPPGRRIAFLEGGYDLEALARSVATTLPGLVGETSPREEPPSGGGPGQVVVDAASQLWSELTV